MISLRMINQKHARDAPTPQTLQLLLFDFWPLSFHALHVGPCAIPIRSTFTYLYIDLIDISCMKPATKSAYGGSQSAVPARKSAHGGTQSAAPATKSAHGGSQSAVPARKSAHGGTQSAAPATKSAHGGSQSAAPATKSSLQETSESSNPNGRTIPRMIRE